MSWGGLIWAFDASSAVLCGLVGYSLEPFRIVCICAIGLTPSLQTICLSLAATLDGGAVEKLVPGGMPWVRRVVLFISRIQYRTAASCR